MSIVIGINQTRICVGFSKKTCGEIVKILHMVPKNNLGWHLEQKKKEKKVDQAVAIDKQSTSNIITRRVEKHNGIVYVIDDSYNWHIHIIKAKLK